MQEPVSQQQRADAVSPVGQAPAKAVFDSGLRVPIPNTEQPRMPRQAAV